MPIVQADWDLHHGGSHDAARHQEKLKDAFKKKLHDIISQEDIITSQNGRKVKVPVKALDSYRFVFDPKKEKHIAQGDGSEELGDVIGKEEDGRKPGSKAGDQEGDDYYEAEIDIADLIEMMLEELELPKLDPKKQADMKTTDVRYDEIRKKGQMSNLDKKRSLIENLKRNAKNGDATIHDIKDDDLRFKTWRDIQKPVTSAVVIAMLDTSGSMTKEHKFLARSFFFWMVNFLRAKYEEVVIEFISHTSTAKVCDEHDFFYKMESGGTVCSSAYELALDLIKVKYNPNKYNIFAFHFSDGDTFGDQEKCVILLKELAAICNLVGYGEINPGQEPQATIFGAFFSSSNLALYYDKYMKDIPNFTQKVIREKEDVWKALQLFFGEAIEK